MLKTWTKVRGLYFSDHHAEKSDQNLKTPFIYREMFPLENHFFSKLDP